MHKGLKKYLAFMLALALVVTTFGSDFASTKSLASEGVNELEFVSERGDDSIFEPIEEISEENLDEDTEGTEVENIEEDTEEDTEENTEYFNVEAVKTEEIADTIEKVDDIASTNATIEVTDEAAEGAATDSSEESENVDASTSSNTSEGIEVALEASTDIASDATSESSLDAATCSSSIDASASASSSIAAASASSSIAAASASSSEEIKDEEELEFNQETTINGIKITLYAKPGVLPEDAELRVDEIESEIEDKITEAVDSETGDNKEVEKTISYDINIYSESEGGYVQPEDGTVEVTFEDISEASDEDITLAVYHVEEDGGEVENVEEVTTGEDNSSETAISFAAEHFSIYAIVLIRESDNKKVAKFSFVPVDESNDYNRISITSEGRTYITFDSDLELEAKDVALDLDEYEFVAAYFGSVTDGKQFTKFVSSEKEKKVDLCNGDKVVETIKYTSNDANCEEITFVYRNTLEDTNGSLVYFFVLYEGEPLPATSDGQSSKYYYPGPEEGSHGDTNTKWLGRAVTIDSIPENERDTVNIDKFGYKGGNLWDLQTDENGNLYSTGEKVKKYILSSPSEEIADYFANVFSVEGFSEDDIVWYVYKKQADALHIDGYINSSITYDANYPGNTQGQVVDKIRFGTDYEVRDYMFTESRPGYRFIGWSLDKNSGAADSDYAPGTETNVKAKLTLYAQWVKDDSEIVVKAVDQTWTYDGKEHSNNLFTFECDETKYTVTAVTTDGKVKNVSDTKELNNKITTVTVKDVKTNKVYTLKVEGDQAVPTDEFDVKVTVYHSKLTILPKEVTLTSKTLTKEFDGTALTADERYKNGVTDARNISATGFITGEGINADKTNFTGKRVKVGGTGLKENSFDYVLASNTLAENYTITKEYGDLIITPRKEKYKLKISLKAGADGTGRDTYVIYNGETQQAIMEVHVTVSGEVAQKSVLDAIIEAIKNGASDVLSSGSLVVYAADESSVPEGTKVDKTEINIDGITITVDNLYVSGGSGVNVGDYPINLDYSAMTITTVIDGETVDISEMVEIEYDTDFGTFTSSEEKDIERETEVIGYLHVLKRDVLLTSPSASKVYDGTPLTAKDITATGTYGFVEGEGADYNVTGSQTEVGSSENTFTYTLKSNTLASNYEITTKTGTLTVTSSGGGDNPPTDDDNPPTDDDNPPTDDTTPPPTSTTTTTPPAQAVLGARREDVAANGQAVLGARRASTDDMTTNSSSRIFTMIMAAGAAITMLVFGKKKEENED